MALTQRQRIIATGAAVLLSAILLVPGKKDTATRLSAPHRYGVGPLPTYLDTIISGWVVRLRPGTTGETIVMFYGAGQTGNGTLAHDTPYINQFGPEYWITQRGWDGSVTLGNGVHHPTYVSVIQPGNSGFTPVTFLKPVLDGYLNSRFAAFKGKYNMAAWGFSAGGWLENMFNTTQVTTGDTTYYNYFAFIADLQGVIANDNNNATLPYPQRFGHRMAVRKYTYLGIEGTFDESRDIWGRRDNMLDSVPTSKTYGLWTTDGGGAHCCWNDYMDPSMTNFTSTNTWFSTVSHDGATANYPPGGQNLAQMSLRAMADTSLGNTPPVASAGSPQQIQSPTSQITLTGTASGTNGATIASQQWSILQAPTGSAANITSPTSLSTQVSVMTVPGNYVFRLVVIDNHGLTDTVTTRANVLPACNLNPGRRITIQANNGTAIDLDAHAQGWLGGDTILIKRGYYSSITLYNFTGDPCRRITVMPDSFVMTKYFSLNTHTQYVDFIGKNLQGVPYSFQVDSGNTASAISGGLCNHVSIQYFYINFTLPGSAGIFLKTTPDPTKPETIYPNYQMTDIKILHNKIRKAGDEAMYIGSTSPWLQDSGQPPYFPIRLDSVEIAYNTIDSSGWDGIQLSGALDGAKIHDDTVTHYGINNISGQQAGIILGSCTRGDVYNNRIISGTGNAIQLFNYGVSKCYNNFIDSAGNGGVVTGAQNAILTNDQVSNLEIVPAQKDSISNTQIYHAQATKPTIQAYNGSGTALAMDVRNTLICIPTGQNGSGLAYYIQGSPSPSTASNTLSSSCSTLPPTVNAGVDQVITLPTSSSTLSGTAVGNGGATISSTLWSLISGPNTPTIATPATLTTGVSGLIQGVYTFQLSATDNSSNSNQDQMTITVNAALISTRNYLILHRYRVKTTQ